MAVLPYFPLMRSSSLAKILKASSHEIRTHSSLPRSSFLPPPGAQFLRFIGVFEPVGNRECGCVGRGRAHKP